MLSINFLQKIFNTQRLKSSFDVAMVGGYSATAMFTAYQAYLTIFLKLN